MIGFYTEKNKRFTFNVCRGTINYYGLKLCAIQNKDYVSFLFTMLSKKVVSKKINFLFLTFIAILLNTQNQETI